MASPSLSIIIPTRERAFYLKHSIRTCLVNPSPDIEILVLDNASSDNTAEVIAEINDPRVRYVRNEYRLSMRDNFEKGINLSNGEILCFIGDDDGLLPYSAEVALDIFKRHSVDAVSASRAHYFWPDLLLPRKNTALIPRNKGLDIRKSRSVLFGLLGDNDYFKLPCLYHGFVRRTIVDRIKQRQGRFFLSSQVDIYSSIVLSMENINYAFSQLPLIINGGSSRSNGASHFAGGTQEEKSLWMQEDDLGFLPGFAESLTLGGLIVESAIRYADISKVIELTDMLSKEDIIAALNLEAQSRLNAGRSIEDSKLIHSTYFPKFPDVTKPKPARFSFLRRVLYLLKSFKNSYPLDLAKLNVVDIYEASKIINSLIKKNRITVRSSLFLQISAAIKIT